MLRRHLGLPIYENSASQIKWHHYHAQMDPRGDRNAIYKSGFDIAYSSGISRSVRILSTVYDELRRKFEIVHASTSVESFK